MCKNNYRYKKQLDTNPSLTLAQILHLPAGDRSFFFILLAGIITTTVRLEKCMHHRI